MRRAVVGAVLLAGCSVPDVVFECATSEDCTLDGRTGLCEDTGFCSFESSACATGREYGPYSGALEGTCVARDQLLAVTLPRSQRGRVVSTPEGIDCPGTCEASFPFGTEVTLTPVPETGAAFGGWLGDCTTKDACVIALDAPRSVGAKFWGGEVRWARAEGGVYSDEARDVAWSASGQLYMGHRHEAQPADDDTLFADSVFSQTYPGGVSGFVLARDANTLTSVERLGAIYSLKIESTATGPIVAADFEGTISTPLRVVTATGGFDVFVARLSSNLANAQWVRSFGRDNLPDSVDTLTVDRAGDVLVSGLFVDSIDPCKDGAAACVIDMGTSNEQHTFLAKLDGDTGATVTAIALEGTVLSVAATADGGYLIAGKFFDELTIVRADAAGASTIIPGPANGAGDGYILALDASLQPGAVWTLSSAGNDYVSAVAIAANGDVIAGGGLGATADLGYGPVPGANHQFVARLSAALTPLPTGGWARTVSDEWASLTALGVDLDDAIVVTGSFNSPGSITLTGAPLVVQGTTNVWLAKLDGGTGDAAWARAFGVGGVTLPSALAIAPSGAIALAGTFDTKVVTEPSIATLTNISYSQSFVMEVAP